MSTPQVRLETSEVGVGLGLVHCHINDERCWIVRTDNNNAGKGHHPLTLVEIVAPVHLRTALALDDGDMVRITVAAQPSDRPKHTNR